MLRKRGETTDYTDVRKRLTTEDAEGEKRDRMMEKRRRHKDYMNDKV